MWVCHTAGWQLTFFFFFNKLGAGRFVLKYLLDFMFGDYRKDKTTADENCSCFWIQLAIFCIGFIVLTQSHAAQEKSQISKDYTHKNITGKQSIFGWYRDVLTFDMNRVPICTSSTKLRRGEGTAYQCGTVLQVGHLQ